MVTMHFFGLVVLKCVNVNLMKIPCDFAKTKQNKKQSGEILLYVMLS